MSHDGRTAYSAGRDGTVIAWDLTGNRRWERRFEVSSAPGLQWARLNTTADSSEFSVIAADGGVDIFDGHTLRRTATSSPPAVARSALRSHQTAGSWR